MQKKYENQVAFYVVYIREAHPTNGNLGAANQQEGIRFEQPTTLESRLKIAQEMCEKLEISIPCLIDGIDNRVGTAYEAWPDRLYLIGKDGRIVFKGGPGPGGFRSREVEQALERYLPTIAEDGRESKPGGMQ